MIRFPSASTVRMVPSRALKLALVFFCVTSMLRAMTMLVPFMPVIRSLMLALLEVCPMDLGSWTKDCPDLLPGGREPVTAYFRDSIMVVFPQPFACGLTYSVLVLA